MTNLLSYNWIYTSPGGRSTNTFDIWLEARKRQPCKCAKAAGVMTVLLRKTWIYRTSPEGEVPMLLPLWALLGLMPGRFANKTSAITITTTAPVVVTKAAVAISIVTS